MGQFLIGVDLGTTAIKVGIVRDDGTIASSATCEHALITSGTLVVEQTAEKYWQAFKSALRAAIEKGHIPVEELAALSISAQGETLLAIDGQNRVLRNAIVWMDNRAQEEAEYLKQTLGAEEIFSVTGQPEVMALWPAAKILWLQRHEPEIFENTEKYLLLEDYFFARLGAGYYGEGSLWCSTLLWDITRKCYWQEMLQVLGIREDQLPVIKESGTRLGTISEDVAKELGLPNHLQLVMGGLDQVCGAIGVGNAKPGIFTESTGAALACCTMTPKPVLEYDNKIPCFYTAITDQYMLHTFSSGGIATRWLRDTLCTEEMSVATRCNEDAYTLMNRQAETIPVGSNGLIVLPHFQGSGPPDSDQHAKCMIYGLSLSHTKADIIRAFMEGVAIVLCRMVEAVEAMGVSIDEIRSLSGGAKSPLWCQIKADALGKPVVVMESTEDAACLGAAFLAGVGIGIWPSVAHVADAVVKPTKVFYPNEKNHKLYQELLSKYKTLTNVMRPVNKTLS